MNSNSGDTLKTSTLRRTFSRRSAAIGGAIGLVLAGRFTSERIANAAAQEATPEGGMTMDGVTLEPIAFGVATTLPATPALFQMARMRFAPGGHVIIPADDPGLVLIYVEAGTLSGTATAPTRVLRAARFATPEAELFEDVAAGSAYTVEPGDSFIGEPSAGGDFRNEGPDEAVLLIAGLQPDSGGAPPA